MGKLDAFLIFPVHLICSLICTLERLQNNVLFFIQRRIEKRSGQKKENPMGKG